MSSFSTTVVTILLNGVAGIATIMNQHIYLYLVDIDALVEENLMVQSCLTILNPVPGKVQCW